MTLPTSNPGAPAPVVQLAPFYKDPRTGETWVHKDLVLAREAWSEETHIGPINTSEQFGDVESWVAYIKSLHLHGEGSTLLTWNARGLQAILDYHSATGTPGRLQWTASCPFVSSPAWCAWMKVASGQPISHKTAVETLEDLAPDIVSPPAADLAALLRSLRATVNASAQTDLRADGTSSVSFSQEKRVNLPGLDLPPEFVIAIRVLVGHVDEEGKTVRYRLPVKVRVNVGDDAKLAFRFSIPTAERVMEDVLEDRIKATKALLGEGFSLLRAAD